jgi:diguanylate cyclase (GGDEF)-like protein
MMAGLTFLTAYLAPFHSWELEAAKAFAFLAWSSAILVVLFQRERRRRDELELTLRAEAIYDPLTGLLNRSFLADTLRRAIAQASRENDCKVGVVFLDLDGFKQVNDRFGHHAGDELLAEVGKRILKEVRAADCAARFGGDEFVVVVARDRNGGTEHLAQRLAEGLRRPFMVGDTSVALTASVGFALFPDHGRDAGQLVRAADQAMYRVKEIRRDGVLRGSLEPTVLFNAEFRVNC